MTVTTRWSKLLAFLKGWGVFFLKKEVGFQIYGYGHQLDFIDPAHQYPSNKVKSYAYFCEGQKNDRNDMQRVAHTKFYAWCQSYTFALEPESIMK